MKKIVLFSFLLIIICSSLFSQVSESYRALYNGSYNGTFDINKKKIIEVKGHKNGKMKVCEFSLNFISKSGFWIDINVSSNDFTTWYKSKMENKIKEDYIFLNKIKAVNKKKDTILLNNIYLHLTSDNKRNVKTTTGSLPNINGLYSGHISKKILLDQVQIFASNKYTITEYAIIYFTGGKMKVTNVPTDKFTTEVKQIVNECKIGSILNFVDIIAKSKSGKQVFLPPMRFVLDP